MSTHTVDDVKCLMDAIGIGPKTAKAILEAIAPAIASRALREAADEFWISRFDESVVESARTQDWLRDRADQIEAGS